MCLDRIESSHFWSKFHFLEIVCHLPCSYAVHTSTTYIHTYTHRVYRLLLFIHQDATHFQEKTNEISPGGRLNTFIGSCMFSGCLDCTFRLTFFPRVQCAGCCRFHFFCYLNGKLIDVGVFSCLEKWIGTERNGAEVFTLFRASEQLGMEGSAIRLHSHFHFFSNFFFSRYWMIQKCLCMYVCVFLLKMELN